MTVVFQTPQVTLHQGDCLSVLKSLPSESIHTAITSPPYFALCDYKVEGQLGLECTIAEYLERLTAVFREVRRVLVHGAVLWVVIGDTQNNYSPIRGKGERRSPEFNRRRPMQEGFVEKEQLMIPSRLVDAMRQDGWLFRRELIWDKCSSGAMANSDTAPLTHESILQFGKWDRGGRPYLNCKPLKSSILRYPSVGDPIHPCPFPLGLVRELLSASMDAGETVLDPFAGSGTSLAVGQEKGCAIGIELNPEYCQLVEKRCAQLTLFGVGA